METEIKYEIVETYGDKPLDSKLTRNGPRYLQLKLVKWYGKPGVLDLRWWGEGLPDKGVTLTVKGAIALRDLLNSMELEG